MRPLDLEKHHLGEWGEKMVLLKLQALGFEVVPKGGFGPHDIEARRLPSGSWHRIEVKTSRWKNEGLRDRDGRRISYWGWLVKDREQKELRFDYLVGVAQVPGEPRTARFFVFSREEAASQPSLLPRAGVKPANVEKKIDLFASVQTFEKACAADPDLFSPLEERLNREPSHLEDAWEKVR